MRSLLLLQEMTKLSVFDEPEAGIDLWSFQNLIQVFERMRKNNNGSILIISHQERILNIADEIVVIADGKIVKQGTREEIMPEIMGTAAAVGVCPVLREMTERRISNDGSDPGETSCRSS